ncbi:MAG: glycosyltransferase, partial [Pseudomonadota bacterium]
SQLQRCSFIVPAWNEAACIADTIAAIQRSSESVSAPAEIIVVDNNSTDNTAVVAEAAGATVVFEPLNQIARTRNTGARASTGEWLIFIDADTLVSPELINRVIELLRQGNTIGGGAAVTFDQKLSGLASMLATVWNWWSVRSRTAAGCFIFCTATAFEQVGGFDERQYVAEELYLSREFRKLAKKQRKAFHIISDYPVVSSARKKDWYSSAQLVRQILVLLLPGASRSKKFCWVWYKRRPE